MNSLCEKLSIVIEDNGDPDPEVLMKRRLTIATPEEDIPEDYNEVEEPLPENG